MEQQVSDKQEPVVEDLTVTESEAGEVKAGAQIDMFLQLRGIDGESSSTESQRTLRSQ